MNMKPKSNRSIFKTSTFVITISVFLLLAAGVWAQDYFIKNEKSDIATDIVNDVAKGGDLVVNGNKTDFSPKEKLVAEPEEIVTYVSKPIVLNNTPNAAVLSWDQTGDKGVTVEARTKNGNEWTHWTKIDSDSKQKDSANQSGPVSALVLANIIDNFQYRVTLKGDEKSSSSEISLAESNIEAIDSTKGPDGTKSVLDKISSYASASALPNHPRILARSEWGSPEPSGSTWNPEYRKLKRAIVHHTVSTENGNPYAAVRAVWQYHARSLGWGDIGYNYLVSNNGTVFQGRFFDHTKAAKDRVDVIAGHSYGNNEGTTGISVLGNYQHQHFSNAARNAVSDIIGYKLAKYGVDPAGPAPIGGPAVIGHFEANQTSCPGANIISRLGEIKSIASASYRKYAPLYTFRSMDIPRWMEVTKPTQKINIFTGEKVEGILNPGTQLFFPDKYNHLNGLYLRTQSSASASVPYGIPMSDLKEITPETLSEPVRLQLTSERRKWNPATQRIDWSVAFPEGLVVSFSQKITIKGQVHYKSSFDYKQGKNLYIRATALSESPTYKPFTAPRYLETAVSSALTHPITGETTGDEIPIGTKLFFDSKTGTAQQQYYKPDNSDVSLKDYAIPASHLKNLSFENIESPVWRRVENGVPIYNPETTAKIGDMAKNAGMYLRFDSKIEMNGVNYMRASNFDFNGGMYAFKEQDIVDIPYEYVPFTEPRLMTITRSLTKVVPSTGQPVGETTPAGHSEKFASKIRVNDKWYARTEADTLSETDLAYPLDSLR